MRELDLLSFYEIKVLEVAKIFSVILNEMIEYIVTGD